MVNKVLEHLTWVSGPSYILQYKKPWQFRVVNLILSLNSHLIAVSVLNLVMEIWKPEVKRRIIHWYPPFPTPIILIPPFHQLKMIMKSPCSNFFSSSNNSKFFSLLFPVGPFANTNYFCCSSLVHFQLSQSLGKYKAPNGTKPSVGPAWSELLDGLLTTAAF